MKHAAVAAILVMLVMSGGCSSSTPSKSPGFNKAGNPEAIKKAITSSSAPARQEGIAAAILLDTSGSMQEPVEGTDRKPKAKIKVAQDSLLRVLQQFSDFGKKHPEQKLVVGIYDFSGRKDQPSCRQVVKLGPPDVAAARSLIQSMVPAGPTPIGDAMITAKIDLAATGMSHQHILVITDGENNLGYLPADVTKVISGEPEGYRAGIYFIAFDIGAELFDSVRNAGGLVLSAANEKQLADTLDFILTGKILVEQPPPPQSHPSVGIKK
jgi:hypothetical protein